jgi:3-deoxy-D-manno-octulosonic-acid transferase
MTSSTGGALPVPNRLPVTLRAYRRLTAAGTPLAQLVLSHRLRRGKEHPQRIAERRGLAELPRPQGPLVWVHGASVGEMLAVIPLVERISARGFTVLVTSGTLTSAELAAHRLPAGAIHQFIPLDAPRFIERFLDHWRPDLALFAEGELWPNLIMESAGRGVPLVLVNGRLSERSFARWRKAPGSIAALLHCFDMCLAQSSVDADRYAELGAPRVTITGNLKLDVPAPPANPADLADIENALAQRPVIAAASTHPGEEALVIDAHRRLRDSFPGLITIVAPRHPERGAGIVDIAAVAGLSAVLRSAGRLPDAGTDIYIADTIGELGLFYRLAPIVFMGGSLVRHGGQNPIEAAKLGAAILHGPHVWNFAEIYAALDASRGAERVTDANKLTVRIGAWLSDPCLRRTVADTALATVELLGGALDRTLSAIDPYLMQFRLEQP